MHVIMDSWVYAQPNVEQVPLFKLIQSLDDGDALCFIQRRSLIGSCIDRVYFSLTYSIMCMSHHTSNDASYVLPSASNMAAAVRFFKEKEKNVPHPFCMEPSAIQLTDRLTDSVLLTQRNFFCRQRSLSRTTVLQQWGVKNIRSR